MLTFDEFLKEFGPLAFLIYKDVQKVKFAGKSYYALVKHYTIGTLREAMLEATEHYETYKDFPTPIQLKRMCSNQIQTIQVQHESKEDYLAKCKTPEALAAKREFYDKMARLHDESGDNKGKWCAGIDSVSTIAIGLGEALILEPYKTAKAYEERES